MIQSIARDGDSLALANAAGQVTLGPDEVQALGSAEAVAAYIATELGLHATVVEVVIDGNNVIRTVDLVQPPEDAQGGPGGGR